MSRPPCICGDSFAAHGNPAHACDAGGYTAAPGPRVRRPAQAEGEPMYRIEGLFGDDAPAHYESLVAEIQPVVNIICGEFNARKLNNFQTFTIGAWITATSLSTMLTIKAQLVRGFIIDLATEVMDAWWEAEQMKN